MNGCIQGSESETGRRSSLDEFDRAAELLDRWTGRSIERRTDSSNSGTRSRGGSLTR